jgi:hypothetical protein
VDLDSFRRARHEPLSGFRTTPISMVSGSVERTHSVVVLEEDILSPADLGTFDAIRAANVLNLCYFSESEIRQMLKAIASRLVPGGLLLVARTEEGINHATMFSLRDGRLTPVGALNRGSEIAHMVAATVIE